MRDLTKSEKKQAKEVLKKGILKRHAEWHNEMRELLDRPFGTEIGNEFDRSMMITEQARKFYKEAMQMEDYYRTSMLTIGLINLYKGGFLTSEDITGLPDDLRRCVENY